MVFLQGVVTAAASLIENLVKKNPEEYKGCVSLAVSRLSRVCPSCIIHYRVRNMVKQVNGTMLLSASPLTLKSQSHDIAGCQQPLYLLSGFFGGVIFFAVLAFFCLTVLLVTKIKEITQIINEN